MALGLPLARDLLQAAPSVGPRALVTAPTRELVSQVGEELVGLLAPVPHDDVAVMTGGTGLGRAPARRDRSAAMLRARRANPRSPCLLNPPRRHRG